MPRVTTAVLPHAPTPHFIARAKLTLLFWQKAEMARRKT